MPGKQYTSMHQVIYNNKLEHKYTLIHLTPGYLYRPIYAKGNLSFRDTCPDSYNFLSVLCVLCVLCLAAVCSMHCQAASNAYYAVLSSFQRVLHSFSRSLHCIYTILRPYLLKLYIIATYLGHWTNTFDFYTL